MPDFLLPSQQKLSCISILFDSRCFKPCFGSDFLPLHDSPAHYLSDLYIFIFVLWILYMDAGAKDISLDSGFQMITKWIYDQEKRI